MEEVFTSEFTTGEWPAVTSVIPQDGATDISTETKIFVTFNKDMAIDSTGAVRLQHKKSTLVIQSDKEWDGARTLILTPKSLPPKSALLSGNLYTVTVKASLTRDAEGNTIVEDFISEFTTR
jgi:hypothetical protein